MNQAYATFTVINPTRAIVDMKYQLDGGKNHTGFSTVEVDLPRKLYDACYQRADALAETQNCRLETFKQAPEKPYRIHFTNFQYFYAVNFETLEEAKATAKDKGFECAIYKDDSVVATWGPISGFQSVQ